MSAGMKENDDFLWREVVRCFLSYTINRGRVQPTAYDVLEDSLECGICTFISQIGGVNEFQVKEEYHALFDSTKKMSTAAGTTPLPLQICSVIGFLAGIVNGIIMVATAFHLTFVLLFIASSLVACSPLFYRRSHGLEYDIVAALQKRLYPGCDISSLLVDIYKEVCRK